MKKKSRIFIVGHKDAVEQSLFSHFSSHGHKVISNTRNRIDVLSQNHVQKFFKDFKPEYVFLGSLCSGGIEANQKYAAQFIYENLESQNNVIHAACTFKTQKLMYFTGSCTYPRVTPQPMKEESLLTGPLELTSEPYSIAKIAGTKLCEAYRLKYRFNAIVAVPATLYGPGADSNLETAHVMGALIGKFCRATLKKEKQVVVWGTGKPRREFLYVDDFARACVFLMDHYNDASMINVGCGYDISIRELAVLIKKVSGFRGKIIFDSSKPDGTMRKLMDNSRIKKLGWKPKVSLQEGICRTLEWYRRIKC